MDEYEDLVEQASIEADATELAMKIIKQFEKFGVHINIKYITVEGNVYIYEIKAKRNTRRDKVVDNAAEVQFRL